MFLAMLLAAAAGSFAATPERAALQAVGFKTQPKVVRVNRSGRFATVLTRGGKMEGSPVVDPLLLERFSFGWQPLTLVNSQCGVREMQTIAGAASAQRLMTGMPVPEKDPGKCFPVVTDRGTTSDVSSIRRQIRGPLVPYVLVSRDWALAEWYGAGGGDALFHRSRGAWHLVRSGGGSMDVSILRAFGVPLSDACRMREGLAARRRTPPNQAQTLSPPWTPSRLKNRM